MLGKVITRERDLPNLLQVSPSNLLRLSSAQIYLESRGHGGLLMFIQVSQSVAKEAQRRVESGSTGSLQYTQGANGRAIM